MYNFVKRSFDIFISILIIILIFPLLLIITLIIFLSSGFPIFYLQERVGKNWENFKIIKFRTMVKNAEKLGPGISSDNDKRITRVGKILRKLKLDELPQFFNVLFGNMSIIGPRPELLKYAVLFKEDYSHILSVKPGISDYASIVFRNEFQLLKDKDDVENVYINEILPKKIYLYKKYLNERSILTDIKIFFLTIKKVFK